MIGPDLRWPTIVARRASAFYRCNSLWVSESRLRICHQKSDLLNDSFPVWCCRFAGRRSSACLYLHSRARPAADRTRYRTFHICLPFLDGWNLISWFGWKGKTFRRDSSEKDGNTMRFDIWETWREAINRMTLKTFKHSANCLEIDSNFVFLLRNNFKIRLLSLSLSVSNPKNCWAFSVLSF